MLWYNSALQTPKRPLPTPLGKLEATCELIEETQQLGRGVGKNLFRREARLWRSGSVVGDGVDPSGWEARRWRSGRAAVSIWFGRWQHLGSAALGASCGAASRDPGRRPWDRFVTVRCYGQKQIICKCKKTDVEIPSHDKKLLSGILLDTPHRMNIIMIHVQLHM
jgi:hypothetical protein